MLDELAVRNLGIIDDARIEPVPGLTVITGETGTGKTLLLGALRLLVGRTPSAELVGPQGDDALAEGRFITEDGEEVGVARRLSRGGRSRAYMNGSITSAAALDELADGLVEIIGQHDHLRITRPMEARKLVDRLLTPAGLEAVGAYRDVWRAYREVLAAREDLGGDLTSMARELDLTEHQANEIGAAKVLEAEDEHLEGTLVRLRNLDSLREQSESALESLSRAREEIGRAVADLRRATKLDHELASSVASAEGVESQLGDLALEIGGYREALDVDAGALEVAENRMRVLGDLKRRYGPSLADVLGFRLQALTRAADLRARLDRASRIDGEVEAAAKALDSAGARLLEHRRAAAGLLADRTEAHLRDLGFADPFVLVSAEDAEPGPSGADRIEIRFASDRRLEPADIAKVASGGELSRLVLSLRLAAGVPDGATLVFDEVDAGVGGVTALALGEKLAALATTRQVVCVTHLPQVAAFADRHYSISRSENVATVEEVGGERRLEELARMLAGLPESERGREAAGELLALAAGA